MSNTLDCVGDHSQQFNAGYERPSWVILLGRYTSVIFHSCRRGNHRIWLPFLFNIMLVRTQLLTPVARSPSRATQLYIDLLIWATQTYSPDWYRNKKFVLPHSICSMSHFVSNSFDWVIFSSCYTITVLYKLLSYKHYKQSR